MPTQNTTGLRVRGPLGREYYSGKTLLITGATGLVGKVLIEAVLRKLPEVRKVYALIRPRAMPAAQALQNEVLASSAFDALRAEYGDGFDAFARARVEAVEGDLSRERLGLSDADWARLSTEVDLIINSGALAVFDARLDHALETNTLGPGRVLEFARSATKRPFVAHISTCYVNNRPGPIFETVPDPAADFDVDDEVRALASRVAELREVPDAAERLVAEGMRWARRRGWFDTYTFTKALGERLFIRHQGEVEGLIFRPSIIESALRTPMPGWIDGFRMADPIIVGYARRQIFDFPGNPESVLDLIPSDIVVDALLMCIPHAHNAEGARLYQCASGMENPLFLKHLRVYLREYYERTPLRRANLTGAPDLPPMTLPELGAFLRHVDLRYLLPLRLQEKALAPFKHTPWGKRKRTTIAARRARLERLRNMAAIYGPYTQSQSRFLTFNLRAVWEALPEADRERFPFRIAAMEWRRYIQDVHLPGIERYLLRMKRTPVAPAVVPAPAGSGVGEAATHWEKAARLLQQTREVSAAEAMNWTTPIYKKVIQRVSRRLIRLICRKRFELESTGHEHLPERGPFIVVANHTSHIDTGVLLTALDHVAGKVHPTAAADYWFKSPLLAWFLHSTLGAIPFDRRSRNVARAASLPAQVLRNGHSLIFYPEGTRSLDGEIQEFKSTVGLLALASGAPIVPAYISEATGALAKGEVFIKHHAVRVRFGKPIDIEPRLGRLDRQSVASVARELARDAQAAVTALRDTRMEPLRAAKTVTP